MEIDIPDWCSMLMVGSPGVGMLEFTLSLANDYLDRGDTVIFVTVDKVPRDITDTLGCLGAEVDSLLGNRLFIVDFHTSLLGSFGSEAGDHRDGVMPVSDLEGIMYQVDSVAGGKDRPVRVFLHSVSTLFLYNQTNVVLKFFQITASRIRADYGTAIMTLHDGVHDQQAVNHLMAISDGTIELRFDAELRRRMRIRNVKGVNASGDWIPFNIRMVEPDSGVSLLTMR